MNLKTSYAKWRPFCLGLNVLIIFHNIMTSWHTNAFRFNDILKCRYLPICFIGSYNVCLLYIKLYFFSSINHYNGYLSNIKIYFSVLERCITFWHQWKKTWLLHIVEISNSRSSANWAANMKFFLHHEITNLWQKVPWHIEAGWWMWAWVNWLITCNSRP